MVKSSPELVATGQDQLMRIGEASRFTGYAVGWLYQMVMKGEIPFYRQRRRLMFSKLELADWVMHDRPLSQEESDRRASDLIAEPKRR